jgi:small-conductance mechanosensitive channel
VEAYSWTNLEIWRAFRDNGIEIPFPQVDLHVRSGVPPAVDEASPAKKTSPGIRGASSEGSAAPAAE